jgi:hypothetical protein
MLCIIPFNVKALSESIMIASFKGIVSLHMSLLATDNAPSPVRLWRRRRTTDNRRLARIFGQGFFIHKQPKWSPDVPSTFPWQPPANYTSSHEELKLYPCTTAERYHPRLHLVWKISPENFISDQPVICRPQQLRHA